MKLPTELSRTQGLAFGIGMASLIGNLVTKTWLVTHKTRNTEAVIGTRFDLITFSELNVSEILHLTFVAVFFVSFAILGINVYLRSKR